jgi:environmental stress-induced protein Ves
VNVMTRRSVYHHRLTRVTLQGEESLVCTGEMTLLVVVTGDATASDEHGTYALEGHGVLVLTPGEPLVRVASEAGADFILVHVWRR